MRLSICHYSFHREVSAGNMPLEKYFRTVRELGLDACDLHMRLTGDIDANRDTILKGLEENGLTLSSYSFSNNFTVEDPDERKKQIELVKQGLRNARALGADTARVFGGHAKSNDPAHLEEMFRIVTDALKECVEVAEEVKVVMALENHGGMPGRGEEVVRIIEEVGSDYLRCCCDLGNFRGAAQEPPEGTRIVAPVTAYVHVKDNREVPEGRIAPRANRAYVSTVVGEGTVDVPGCLRILKEAGYTGFVALEYEGQEEEATGVPKSIGYLKKVLADL